MTDSSDRSMFAEHSREFRDNRYVYPVLSRRAGGVSIGVNLNPDAACNFDCIYCQVHHHGQTPRSAAAAAKIDIDLLGAELDRMVDWVVSGRIWRAARFAATPAPLRRLNDIAFSGDGEPTMCREFDKAAAAAAEIRSRRRLDQLKLILITNSTLLDRPWVRRGLEIMDTAGGEIWAKLDAGSEEYYRTVNRSKIPLQKILDNLLQTSLQRPIVIQSLFMEIHGRSVPEDEQQAYCQRLREIVDAGGQINQVQIHTVARAPAESWVAPLANEQVDSLAERVRLATGLTVTAYYGKPKAVD